ncbi:MAG: DUF433 domain-containing protein [Pirellulales bacterium]
MQLPLMDTIPIREDEGGALRVGNTRVVLELVLRAYQDGATVEEIVESYDALSLADVHSVIGYYLHHRAEMDELLEDYERKAEEIRKRIEAAQPELKDLRQRLLARRAAMENANASPGN